MTENVFRQGISPLLKGFRDIWRAIAKHSLWEIAKHSRLAIAKHSLREIALLLVITPRVPSQGKILKVLKCDCEALPVGDRIASPTSDRIQCSPRFLLKGKF
ncbi:hypothetical protein [Cylindrospermopsis sp. CR12]|uniref:hypothetical protein n=1 Tax=Cylindrospermopsis sp. CR12 TaxID=1747196 RepID=UPI00128F679B|nr:hypothetical protein [Cylindrospermopsis sp. CR12]